ncbi:5-formyltetrahydrofolate cyclo-ligase [Shewanella sp. 125m-7]
MLPKSELSPSNVDTQASRKAIRSLVREARRSLSEKQQKDDSITAASRAISQLEKYRPNSVALYLSNDGELDTKPLIEALWQQGIKVYLPRLHPFSKGNLIFLRYERDSELIKSHLGIWEPKLDITQMLLAHQLDVVITPLVAFDLQGNRMGMGGGYYDRTLANWQLKGKPLPIGYAHDCQLVDALPCEHWDVALPYIFTPSHSYQF